jgi:hypothetical protein
MGGTAATILSAPVITPFIKLLAAGLAFFASCV